MITGGGHGRALNKELAVYAYPFQNAYTNSYGNDRLTTSTSHESRECRKGRADTVARRDMVSLEPLRSILNSCQY